MSETGSDQDIFESLSNSQNEPLTESVTRNHSGSVDENFASSLVGRLRSIQSEALVKLESGDACDVPVKLECNEDYDDVIVNKPQTAEIVTPDVGSTVEFMKDVSDMLSDAFDEAGKENEDYDMKPSPSLTPLSLDSADCDMGVAAERDDCDTMPSPCLTPLSISPTEVTAVKEEPASSPDIDEDELDKNMNDNHDAHIQSDGEDDLDEMNDDDLVDVVNNVETPANCDDMNNNAAGSASVTAVTKFDASKYSYQPRTNKNLETPRKPALKPSGKQNSILSFFSMNGGVVKPNESTAGSTISSMTRTQSAPAGARPSAGTSAAANRGQTNSTYGGKRQFNRQCPFYKKIPGNLEWFNDGIKHSIIYD